MFSSASPKFHYEIAEKLEDKSKILHTCKYEEGEMDLLKYNPKVSSSERNAGLDGIKSSHPTMKPISLIKHIATLFKLPDKVGQKWYVPFAGSGSEIIGILKTGVKEENIKACEINPEYVEIAKARIKHYTKQKGLKEFENVE